ncbi:MAG: type II CRISPR RNA-guided endonuclease Cas9 [Bacteroidales bacterium]|nr:type II CRISPR RNA-guided endonuclease Cas9 [Bacteroidales bacterium]
MGKILGLDLGTNSIGWAIVDTEDNKIENCGVRIFPEGVVKETIGTGDREQTKNATRREKRQSRRQYFRKRLRKAKLLKILIEQKMCPLTYEEVKKWERTEIFPSSNDFTEWLKLNPYELRAKALKEDVSLMELGRIFYHFIQRRGFLSSRKNKEEGKIFEGKENMVGIDDTKQQIKGTTLGNYLHSILPEQNTTYYPIKDANGNEMRARARYTLREMYVGEFEMIWANQAERLGLDLLRVENKRVRFLKGDLDNIRNAKRINYLTQKYGKNNVVIEKINREDADLYRVVTKELVPLKEAIAGDIVIDDDNQINFKSNESILFWQRPLRSQKSLLSKCTFEGKKFFDKKTGKWIEVGPTPVPVSHPDFELFRAYQFVNTIEYGTKQKLTDEQREQVVAYMKTMKDSFNFSKIREILSLTYEQFNYQDDAKVVGCPTIAQISKLFKADVWHSNYVDIWHSFLFYEDSDKLLSHLIQKYGLKEVDYEKIAGKTNEETGKRTPGIRLKEDYASVSLKAIRNILPFLKKGRVYSDAVILGGVRNAFGVIDCGNGKMCSRYEEYFKEYHEEIERNIIHIVRDKTNKEGDAIDKIKLYLSNPDNNLGFSENDKAFRKLYHHSQEIEKKKIVNQISPVENLRNPIVQQGVNETRRLVNRLIKTYGKFDQIKVELARDLKHGKKVRQEVGRKISDNLKSNQAARQVLTEYGLAHSRDNIQKYLLWMELQSKNGKPLCPYTGKIISVDDVLGGENRIQIEHIIPKSVSLDDSFANKTLCDSTFNREKGELTPRQFYVKNSDSKLWGTNSWEEVEQRAFKLLPYAKAKRFTTKKEDWDSGEFIERQLNDTRYISKKTAEILSEVCDSVRVMPGSLTSELRHLWGLNNILEPVRNLGKKEYDVDENRSIPYYAVANESNEIEALYKKFNDKPITNDDETTVAGFISKEGVFASKYLKLKVDNLDLPNGKYWAVMKLSKNPVFTKIFIEKPETEETELVLRGKIDKNRFLNDTIKKRLPVNLDNGSYWAKFNVLNINFEEPEKGKQPQNKKGIVLFGEVKSGVFKSYIYECKTNMVDGKYWALIDLDIEKVEYFSAIGQPVEPSGQQISIEGTIDQDGVFVSELDPDFSIQTNKTEGKYWALFDIQGEPNEFTIVENPAPELEQGQQLIEGSVWVDKLTGEIKFDPKKNREDHRHHAIDAIAIALTEQSYLQKLSKYNADKEDRKRGIESQKPQFDEPWPNFYHDAKAAASKILISHKQNTESVTNISKTILKNGETIRSKGQAVRGQLHKENVFGKRQAPNSEIAFHRRKSVDELKTPKHFEKIVDPIIRDIVIKAKGEEIEKKKQIETLEKRLRKASEQQEVEIKAQIEEIKQEIALLYSLPNKNGDRVPIKKVRVKENIGNAQQLKTRLGINQYVNPRNNHHVLIYKDEEESLNKQVVSLWEVVERKKQGQSVFQLPPVERGKSAPTEIVETLQINDMFILGLTDEEFQDNINNFTFLSKHLYKVQKLSKFMYFRHHLDSRKAIEAEKDYITITGFGEGKGGWITHNPIKVKIDILGKIKK